jgi:chemotaxis protein CheZ
VPRKLFRIEQTFDRRRMSATAQASRLSDGNGLAAMRDIVAAHKVELAALIGEGRERHLLRAAGDLGAAVEGVDEAAHAILKTAEAIDASAKALAATLRTARTRALAQDIREHTARIFESCSFQDLAGQRVGKAIALLSMIEERLGVMLARCDGIEAAPRATTAPAADGGLINGPRLDGDSGHVSQQDIDRMFG